MWKVPHPFGGAYDASQRLKMLFHRVVGNTIMFFFVDAVRVSSGGPVCCQ
jgi:hypothetical protein